MIFSGGRPPVGKLRPYRVALLFSDSHVENPGAVRRPEGGSGRARGRQARESLGIHVVDPDIFLALLGGDDRDSALVGRKFWRRE